MAKFLKYLDYVDLETKSTSFTSQHFNIEGIGVYNILHGRFDIDLSDFLHL